MCGTECTTATKSYDIANAMRRVRIGRGLGPRERFHPAHLHGHAMGSAAPDGVPAVHDERMILPRQFMDEFTFRKACAGTEFDRFRMIIEPDQASFRIDEIGVRITDEVDHIAESAFHDIGFFRNSL